MISYPSAARALAELYVARLNDPTKSRLLSEFQRFSPAEEAELFRLAEQNSALIYTVKQLERLPYQSALLEENKKKIIPVIDREKRRYEKILTILRTFEEEKIEIIALKGTALGAFLYLDHFYKRMNDFDFLIQVEDLEKVKATLKLLGYLPVGDLLDKEKDVKSTHHLSPWVSDDLHCILGIHWNLISPKRSEKVPVHDLWSERVLIEEMPHRVFRLSTAHFLMHLMLHLPDFKTGVREVADLTHLARFADAKGQALNTLPELAKAWNAKAKVGAALAWVKALDPTSPILKVPGLKVPYELEAFSAQGPMVLYFRTLQLSKVEKLFAKSWLSLSPAKKIQGWAQSWKEMLFPSYRQALAVLKMSESHGIFGWLKVRFMAPMAIWDALCKDHGTVKIYVVTIMNCFAVPVNLTKMILWPPSVMRAHRAEKILDELE